MFGHPAWAVGSYSGGPPAARRVGTKSKVLETQYKNFFIPGFLWVVTVQNGHPVHLLLYSYLVPPPHGAEQSVHLLSGNHSYPTPAGGVSFTAPAAMLYSNSIPGLDSCDRS